MIREQKLTAAELKAQHKKATLLFDEDEQPEQETALYNAAEVAMRVSNIKAKHGLSDDADADATAHVSITEDGKEVNVWRGDPEDYDLPMVAREHGSGDYRFKFYMRNAPGEMRVKRIDVTMSYRLTSAEEKARRIRLAELNAPVELKPASPVNIEALMASMMNQFQNTMLQFMQAQQANVKPDNTLEIVKSIVPIFAAQHAQQPQRTLLDGIKELSLLKELTKSDIPLLTNDGEVNSSGVLMKGLDLVGNMVAAAKAQQAPTVAPLPMTESMPLQLMRGDELITDNDSEDENMNFIIGMQLRSGVALAKANADGEDYAEAIYDLLPDDRLDELVNDAQWFEKLAAIEPKIALHHAFFSTVREFILRWVAEDSADEAQQSDLTTQKSGASLAPDASITSNADAAATPGNAGRIAG